MPLIDIRFNYKESTPTAHHSPATISIVKRSTAQHLNQDLEYYSINEKSINPTRPH